MSRAYIGLGANLGPAGSTLRWALREFESLGRVRASSLYRTEPLGPEPQQWFLNAVAALDTELGPRPLLRVLLELEARAGRPLRRRRWAPRVLDLDLLLYEGRILTSHDLCLPHPDFHRRRFVLEPLCEIAPDLRDPRTGRRVDELLRDLDDPLRVERLGDRVRWAVGPTSFAPGSMP